MARNLPLIIALGIGIGFASCSKGQLQTTSSTSSSNSTSEKKNPEMNIPELDDLTSEETPGPKILPREELLAYFENQEGKPTYKIPVVLRHGDGFPGGMDEVFIGVAEDMDEADKLLLEPDDSGLGIGLAERVRDAFGDQKICHAWLIGKWGPLIDMPGMDDSEEGVYPFTVHDILVREDGPTENSEALIYIQ